MLNDICAGIVTYNPDLTLFKKCFDSLSGQVSEIVIFDNSSDNVNELEKNYGNRAVIIKGVQNYGIAKALNELCRYADEHKYDWILTMDQDSICAPNMVEELKKYIREDSGIVAPRVEFRADSQLIFETRNNSSDIEEIKACITSGSLTNIKAWKDIGGFDEWMFIDHVDNEFCTNLKVHGYSIIRTNFAVLYQHAGEMKYKKLAYGKTILLPYYSSVRNYYICRNTVYYLRKYKKHINSFHEWSAFIYSQFIKLIFENKRIETIKSTFIGVHDGFSVKVKRI